MVQKLVFLENRQNQNLKQTFFPRTLWGLEKLRKGPEHVLTPNRHNYVYSKAQKIGTKIPFPQVMIVKTKKFQNFKIFNRMPMCVYIYYGVGNVQY